MPRLIRACRWAFRKQLAVLQAESPDPLKQHARYKLVRACQSGIEAYLAAEMELPGLLKAYAAPSADLESSLLGLLRKLKSEERDLQELGSWVFEGGTRLNDRNHGEEAAGELLWSVGYTYREIREQLRRARQIKARAGAPPVKRLRTVEAYDVMFEENLNYPQLAARFCDCGAKQHGAGCAERLRKRSKQLAKVLAKFCDHGRPHRSEAGPEITPPPLNSRK